MDCLFLSMYPDKCFLCKNYRSHKNGVKFFTYNFPRSCQETYKKWLQVCKITEAEEREHSPKICSNCFKAENDFLPLKFDSKKPKLKNGSVPKLFSILSKRKSNEVSMNILRYFT